MKQRAASKADRLTAMFGYVINAMSQNPCCPIGQNVLRQSVVPENGFEES